MKLYHGSNIMIERIDLSKCRPYKDFGQGFYLTEIKAQAEQMARRTSAIYGGEPVVTEFEFDETALNTLAVKTFETPALTVTREREGIMHLDGEPVEMSERIDIKCVKGGLRVFIPREELHKSVITPIQSLVFDVVDTIKHELDI